MLLKIKRCLFWGLHDKVLKYGWMHGLFGHKRVLLKIKRCLFWRLHEEVLKYVCMSGWMDYEVIREYS